MYINEIFSKENVYITVKDKLQRDFLIKYFHFSLENIFIFNRVKFSFKEHFNFIRSLIMKRFDYYILPPDISQKSGKLLYY